MENYYDLLGVSIKSSQEIIKKAYRKKIKQHHPDLYSNKGIKEQKQAEHITKKLNEAYETLSDKVKKSEYDKNIKVEPKKPDKTYYNDKKENNYYYNTNNKKTNSNNNTTQNKKTKVNNNKTLFEKLKKYNNIIKVKLPRDARPYMYFDEETLKNIVMNKPKTINDLKLIRGITDYQMKNYGQNIIKIVLGLSEYD